MLLEFRKLPNKNLVMDEKSKKKLNKVAVGESFLMDFKPKRNYKFHKKMFALLSIVFRNQNKYDTLEDLRTEMKLKSGWYTEHLTMKQGIIYIPKSMSFADMDALEFEDVYSKFIDIALRDFIPMNKQELEEEIVRFM